MTASSSPEGVPEGVVLIRASMTRVRALAAYDLEPDLVTGTTSNTEAGVELVFRLTGLRALDVRKRRNLPELDALLRERLGGKDAPGRGPAGDSGDD